jgi:hypothetical protein
VGRKFQGGDWKAYGVSSIANRIDDAFLSALVATAATARLRYPEMNDREGFEQFLRDSHTVRLSVEYQGVCHPIEHILYKWLRCELVHEGGLPVDIEVSSDDEPGVMSVRARGAPDHILRLGNGWFHHLIAAVTAVPENAEDFRTD